MSTTQFNNFKNGRQSLQYCRRQGILTDIQLLVSINKTLTEKHFNTQSKCTLEIQKLQTKIYHQIETSLNPSTSATPSCKRNLRQNQGTNIPRAINRREPNSLVRTQKIARRNLTSLSQAKKIIENLGPYTSTIVVAEGTRTQSRTTHNKLN